MQVGFISLAFGAGTIYGSIVASGVAYSMMECDVVKIKNDSD